MHTQRCEFVRYQVGWCFPFALVWRQKENNEVNLQWYYFLMSIQLNGLLFTCNSGDKQKLDWIAEKDTTEKAEAIKKQKRHKIKRYKLSQSD